MFNKLVKVQISNFIQGTLWRKWEFHYFALVCKLVTFPASIK